MKPLMLRHLSGERIGRFPVWLMRQAGRYLPRYREIRSRHSFWEMATLPEVAAQVSLLPLEVVDVDAIIFFSDILTLPYGMGLGVEMKESVGPLLEKPLRDSAAFEIFASFSPKEHVPYVGEALTRIRGSLAPEKALLGFAGAPWTVGCYLVEGKAGKKQFEAMKGWMHADPQGLTACLDRLADATLAYLRYQHASGADAVQLFDTWASEMPRAFFMEHYLPLLRKIFQGLRKSRIPSIYYLRHAHHLLADMPEVGMDVLSVDSLLTLGEFESRTGGNLHLQGNLDPVLLFGDEGVVRRETRRLVKEARALSKPAVLNLGHGVLPGASVANVAAFVEEARSLWI